MVVGDNHTLTVKTLVHISQSIPHPYRRGDSIREVERWFPQEDSKSLGASKYMGKGIDNQPKRCEASRPKKRTHIIYSLLVGFFPEKWTKVVRALEW